MDEGGLKAMVRIDLENTKIPVVKLSAKGEVQEISPSGQELSDLWKNASTDLRLSVQSVIDTHIPCDIRIGGDKMPRYWVVILPYGDDVILAARDTTIPDRVTGALMKSRAMLKSLLDQSVDLAFEVDDRGAFRFLTPPQAFSIFTEDWVGHSAHRFFWQDGQEPSRSPLEAQTSGRFESVPVNLPDGSRRFLDFDMESLRDEAGEIKGLLGSCRDVTGRVNSVRSAHTLNLRLSVQNRVTTILNAAESSEELLDLAVKTMLEILRAEAVWILVDYGRGLVPAAVEGIALTGLDLDGLWQELKGVPTPSVQVCEFSNWDLLTAVLSPANTYKGVIIIARDTVISPWSEQEQDLMRAVSDVLTAALSKAMLFDKLYQLSSRDSLTQTLNRRAFQEAVDRRINHQSRTGLGGVLLFIDLDFFKEVNDILGHKAGDEALKLFAKLIQEHIRACDYVGRYGGDEFVVWLEDINIEEGEIKARQIVDAMAEVRSALGDEALRLSASIGVVASTPGLVEGFDLLAEQADTALYEVKQSGKSDVAIAQKKHVPIKD